MRVQVDGDGNVVGADASSPGIDFAVNYGPDTLTSLDDHGTHAFTVSGSAPARVLKAGGEVVAVEDAVPPPASASAVGELGWAAAQNTAPVAADAQPAWTHGSGGVGVSFSDSEAAFTVDVDGLYVIHLSILEPAVSIDASGNARLNAGTLAPPAGEVLPAWLTAPRATAVVTPGMTTAPSPSYTSPPCHVAAGHVVSITFDGEVDAGSIAIGAGNLVAALVRIA